MLDSRLGMNITHLHTFHPELDLFPGSRVQTWDEYLQTDGQQAYTKQGPPNLESQRPSSLELRPTPRAGGQQTSAYI
jgi:hypothetical protein